MGENIGAIADEEIIPGETPRMGSGNHEEKILVSVRLRPLNDKETARNDISDWEAINKDTIVCKQSLPERSLYPSAYTFDRVFGFECPTRQVYEEGAKEVALAVLNGINSSVFAYGQTSSGKTYTMSGITDYAITDIFENIERRKDREFVIKFSAIEIYNEAVRDLLSLDTTPLRLLDDPEKGTTVERLIEETLRDRSHLEELLSICETQRQIGETSLNEASSRSHQILRLTIESSTCTYSGAENSSVLAASVSFVDLAGSERTSQTLSAGARLKEGCHINRSLLTLGTVIRKLSTGKNGHVPYRDSKLTRILQNSLGGNARTAIICTMSPARTHVEQSRNTLLFASCAKEVTTNAKVNLTVSHKALVKQLQKELARMQNELKSLGSGSKSSDSAALLRDKEELIEQMDKQIKELTWQRDLAHSQVENLLQSIGMDPKSKTEAHSISSSLDEDNKAYNEANKNYEDSHRWKYVTQRTDEESVDTCDEVLSMSQLKSGDTPSMWQKEATGSDYTCDFLKEKVFKMQKTIDFLMGLNQIDQYSSSPETYHLNSGELGLTRSRSCREAHNSSSPLWSGPKDETSSVTFAKDFRRGRLGISRKLSEVNYGSGYGSISRRRSQSSISSTDAENISVHDFLSRMNEMAKVQAENGLAAGESSFESHDCYPAEEAGVARISGKHGNITLNQMHQFQSENKSGDDLKEHKTNESINDTGSEFEKQRRGIIEAWQECNVPLIHRTYFFLLFKGDPSDSVYIEVEIRRLSFLKSTFSQRADASRTSMKALNREREMLIKQIRRKFSTTKDREALYQKWGIQLNTKQRCLQLVKLLWTDTEDMEHIKESANLVAKLVDFIDPSQSPKEAFGINFIPSSVSWRAFSWKYTKSSII